MYWTDTAWSSRVHGLSKLIKIAVADILNFFKIYILLNRARLVLHQIT